MREQCRSLARRDSRQPHHTGRSARAAGGPSPSATARTWCRCRRARACCCCSIRANVTCRSARRGWRTCACPARSCTSASTSTTTARCARRWPASAGGGAARPAYLLFPGPNADRSGGGRSCRRRSRWSWSTAPGGRRASCSSATRRWRRCRRSGSRRPRPATTASGASPPITASRRSRRWRTCWGRSRARPSGSPGCCARSRR